MEGLLLPHLPSSQKQRLWKNTPHNHYHRAATPTRGVAGIGVAGNPLAFPTRGVTGGSAPVLGVGPSSTNTSGSVLGGI